MSDNFSTKQADDEVAKIIQSLGDFSIESRTDEDWLMYEIKELKEELQFAYKTISEKIAKQIAAEQELAITKDKMKNLDFNYRKLLERNEKVEDEAKASCYKIKWLSEAIFGPEHSEPHPPFEEKEAFFIRIRNKHVQFKAEIILLKKEIEHLRGKHLEQIMKNLMSNAGFY